MQRLELISLNKNPEPWYKEDGFLAKVSCLNIRSLPKHFEDLKADHAMLKSDIICLTETWISVENEYEYSISDYNSIYNSVGKGKGILIYAKSSFVHVCNANGEGFQITKMTSEKLDVICVYRSNYSSFEHLYEKLMSILTMSKPTLICGDFNICILKNPNNFFSQSLAAQNFQQIIQYASHEKGGLLQHVYIRNVCNDFDIHFHSVYYSDHYGLCITFSNTPSIHTKSKNSNKRKRNDSTDEFETLNLQTVPQETFDVDFVTEIENQN